MSFEHASVTKGLMLGIALTSIAAGIFDVKHYLHLQLIPHISKYHQYWRLFAHHVACANSSDLFLTELLLYNAGVTIERTFGSVKFASFIFISTIISIITRWRIPHRVVNFGEAWIKPLLGEGRSIRRTNRVLPEPQTSARRRRTDAAAALDEDEVVTTARSSRSHPTRPARGSILNIPGANTPASSNDEGTPESDATGGVVRQWMSELAGGARPSTGGVGTVRAPSESEIQILTGMFPDVGREVILGVLQRSPNIEAAAETLLSSQTH
ncbi:DSC E3 ubiquitin ligase complex subunit 2 [Grifola frondosa]|uniref:DSC E3 ubiquitin ligase complex subunit 2 n=1 Tax=Grifola frondosa TaxID=5627 RepID=A0A1C7LZM3_GRIFR|nr:DSC E3 ubiquitin ligase complex subunit 2 [Grifola frondosa]